MAFLTGAILPKPDQEALYTLPVPIPQNLDEQQTAVTYLDTLAPETQRLEKIDELESCPLAGLQYSLLHRAINGKL